MTPTTVFTSKVWSAWDIAMTDNGKHLYMSAINANTQAGNVFEVARPYARSLMRERLTPQSLARQGRRELGKLGSIAAEFPYQLHDVMEELRDGQIEVGFVHKGLDAFMVRLDAALNRLVVALVVVGGLIGSSLIGIFADQGPQVLGVNILSFIGFLLSGLLGLWLLWGVIRSGRL